MKILLTITLLLISTISFSQTTTDRLNYINQMNSLAGDKMKFRVEERSDAPHIIMTFNLESSPDGTVKLTDIPFFVKSADWETFEPMFKLGFVWICFDQVNICYNREEIIEMIFNK